MLKCSKSTISLYETGDTVPDAKNIVRLCDIFGVSCDYLLREDAASTAPEPSPAPGTVTRLLRQAAGQRVRLSFYEDEGAPVCDWCVILDFDGGWANVEFIRERKDRRERRLLPISSISSVTFLPEQEG